MNYSISSNVTSALRILSGWTANERVGADSCSSGVAVYGNRAVPIQSSVSNETPGDAQTTGLHICCVYDHHRRDGRDHHAIGQRVGPHSGGYDALHVGRNLDRPGHRHSCSSLPSVPTPSKVDAALGCHRVCASLQPHSSAL